MKIMVFRSVLGHKTSLGATAVTPAFVRWSFLVVTSCMPAVVCFARVSNSVNHVLYSYKLRTFMHVYMLLYIYGYITCIIHTVVTHK